MPVLQATWWCFTVNAIGNEEPVIPNVFLNANGNCLCYYLFQLERGEGGRLHYQGVLRFSRKVSMAHVKETTGVPHIHLEPCRNIQASLKYCRKEDTRVDGPWEGGEPGQQGRRTDIARATEIIQNVGAGAMKRVAEAEPAAFVKYWKGFQALEATMHPPSAELGLKVFLLRGPTGTGKSRTVHTIDPSVYTVANLAVPWFDGYSGEEAMLLDEMGPNQLCINFLKRLLDVHPISLPVKGAYFARRCKRIYITTNYSSLEEWYPKASMVDIAALARRIHHTFDMTTMDDFLPTVESIRAIIGEPQAVMQEAALPVPQVEGSGELAPRPLSPMYGPIARDHIAWSVSAGGSDLDSEY